MPKHDPTGKNWTDQEIDLIVADYFDMLKLELAGLPFVKAERNRGLQANTGRSRGSIEFKHENISAVLLKLGMPWITGYKPMPNFQTALIAGVERYLDADITLFEGLPDHIVGGSAPFAESTMRDALAESMQVFLEAPPALPSTQPAEPEPLRRLLRKFDPAARDERNRVLGKTGEAYILQFERMQLKLAHRPDLARKVRWVSEEDGDGAGYDIQSFDAAGNRRLLEVKTTRGHKTTPFYLSENERSFSVEQPNEFRLVRLYDFNRAPRAFELTPPLEESVLLRPINYRASFSG